jgi:hypothetical protein
MSKKTILIAIIAIVILIGITFFVLKNKTSQNANGTSGNEMIFFYGESCPHCKNVEKFLADNKSVEEKVKFDKKEVWSNKDNQNILLEKAKICGLDQNNIGVPLFWDGSKCIEGDVDIINLLKEKSNIQ